MSNVFDYLSWRGDLRFSQSEPNEIDMLILAQLTHAPMERLGGACGGTLADMRSAVYPAPPDDTANELERLRYKLWLAAAGTARFAGMTLKRFASRFEPEREKQFAAALYGLDGLGVAAFRGTDSTLVGWKEDFNMSFISPIPSQTDAVAFLNEAGKECHTLYASGHSKGGNLAVYSASKCAPEVRARVKRVYSFDAPGLDDATRACDGYREIYDRILAFVPESSIIGLLMDYHADFSIVESDGVSLAQHNPYLWHVNGARFVPAQGVTRSSMFTDQTLHAFTKQCTPDERRVLVDTLYNILAASRAVRLRDLPRGLAAHAAEVWEAYRDVPPASREVLKKVLSALVSAGSENWRTLFGLGAGKEAKPDAPSDGALPM